LIRWLGRRLLQGLVPSFLDGAGNAPLGHVEILIARLGAIGRPRVLNELLRLQDLDRPDIGFITNSQEPMIDLANRIAASPEAGLSNGDVPSTKR